MKSKSPFSFGNVAWMSIAAAVAADPKHLRLDESELAVVRKKRKVSLFVLSVIKTGNSKAIANALSLNFLQILLDCNLIEAYNAAIELISSFIQDDDVKFARLCKTAIGNRSTIPTS